KYDRVTQRYQYQLLKYSQYQNAFRVHDAEVGVLVKNQPDHPVVLVTSRAKSVAGFTPSLRGVTLGRAAAARQAQATLKNPQLRNAASAIARAPLTHFSDPE